MLCTTGDSGTSLNVEFHLKYLESTGQFVGLKQLLENLRSCVTILAGGAILESWFLFSCFSTVFNSSYTNMQFLVTSVLNVCFSEGKSYSSLQLLINYQVIVRPSTT